MKNLVIRAITFYHHCISPLLSPSCRFHPSCSEYCVEALKRKGLLKGLFLSIYRVIRCNPLNPGGYDPVK